MAIKRVSLYFNDEVPIEKAMWDYIESQGSRKSQTIKRLLEEKINGSSSIAITIDKEEEILEDEDNIELGDEITL